MRANMVVIVSMAIAAVAGVLGFLVDGNWMLLALGCIALVGCGAALVSRQQVRANRTAKAASPPTH